MISRSELRRRASRLDLQETHVVQDYVLNHVLCGIAEDFEELTFRGGTALARIYWPDFRLSEDLDFIAEHGIEDLEARLRKSVGGASSRIDRSLKLNFTGQRGGWSRSIVVSEFGDLLLDINVGEHPRLVAQPEPIDTPYSDLQGTQHRIRCLALGEILGNKWFMLDDRMEPRDLYDLWAGISMFHVPFEKIAYGHRAKYGYPPIRENMQSALRLSGLWEERLAHQLPSLPPFQSVVDDVQSAFDDWQQSSDEEGSARPEG